MNPEIRFVKNKDIDRAKWDQCIAGSPFGIAYSYSWYLDRICPHWDALIGDNYLYIMPLVNNAKLGIQYVYQPFFCQQLGIFSAFVPTSEIVNQFLNAIPERFRLTDMSLNLGNTPTSSNFSIRKNSTYHLSLQPEGHDLRLAYNSNTRRNIQKAVQNKVTISPVSDLTRFLEFTQTNLKEKAPVVKPKHFVALLKVINHSIDNHFGEIYGAWDAENNLVAAVFFVKTNQKCIYLAGSSNRKGTEQSAMFLLIDSFIQNNSGKNLTLDFEGSNIPGVARFYSGFGALPQIYYSVHQNRLPKLFRIFKP